jgi:hypothetical protein
VARSRPGGDDGASATADAGAVWLEAVAPELAAAFPPGVTLLWADEARRTWGWRTFPSGGDTDRIGDQGQQQPVPPRTLLARLAGQPSPTATVCARDWALARGLPADRIPAVAARTGAAAPPEILTRPWLAWTRAACCMKAARAFIGSALQRTRDKGMREANGGTPLII